MQNHAEKWTVSWWSLVLSIMAVILPIRPAQSQVPFSACLDRQDQPIPGIIDNKLGYGAMATIRDGHRVILWNEANLGGASSTTQLFIYLHECAHHSLNHIYKGENRSVEEQADCWAIQLMADGGMINGSHLDELTRELKRFRGDVNHLGGEALVRALQGCLDVRTDREAWDTALAALTTSALLKFKDIQGQRIPDAPEGHYETTQGTPGTYDCELLEPAAIRCMVFAARKQKAAEKRFESLSQIIREWLPSDWTSIEPSPPPSGLARAFIAQDGGPGRVIVLGLTANARVYFLTKPGAGT